jgi:hypothetical protein
MQVVVVEALLPPLLPQFPAVLAVVALAVVAVQHLPIMAETGLLI